MICHRCGYEFRQGDRYNDIVNGRIALGVGECINRSNCDRRVGSRKHMHNLVKRETADVIERNDIDAMMAEIERQLDDDRRAFIANIMNNGDVVFLSAYRKAANHDALMGYARGF